jgi:hypothetical protein
MLLQRPSNRCDWISGKKSLRHFPPGRLLGDFEMELTDIHRTDDRGRPEIVVFVLSGRKSLESSLFLNPLA